MSRANYRSIEESIRRGLASCRRQLSLMVLDSQPDSVLHRALRPLGQGGNGGRNGQTERCQSDGTVSQTERCQRRNGVRYPFGNGTVSGNGTVRGGTVSGTLLGAPGGGTVSGTLLGAPGRNGS